jgi:hypothetical protein
LYALVPKAIWGGATGASGLRWSNGNFRKREPEIKPNGHFIYFAHYRNLHFSSGDRSQMWLLEPDAAYAFPNDDGVTLLTCMPSKEKLPAFKEDLEGSFARFFEGLPQGPCLAARGASRRSWTPPASSIARAPPPGAASPSSATRRSGRTPVGHRPGLGIPVRPPNGSRTKPPTPWPMAETSTGGSQSTARSTGRSSPGTNHRIISDFAAASPYNPVENLMFSAARDERAARHIHAFGSRRIGVRDYLAPMAVAYALLVNAWHRNGRRARRSEAAVADGNG